MRKPKDWGQPCPNPDCSYYRLMDRGNISAISTYMTQSGKRRIFCCSKCKRPFSETRDTVFFDLRTPEEKVMMALKMLLVTVGLSDIGLVLGVTEDTVLMWRERAAHTAQEMNTHVCRDLPVTEVQRDEMWRCITRTHAQQAEAEGESSDLSADGRQWVWSSCAPEYRRILATFVGPRTLERAVQLMQMTAAVVLGVPCFFRDGCSCSLSALLATSQTRKTCEPPGKRGRPRQPVKEPHPDVVSGQISKKKRQGRLQAVVYRVCCGVEGLEELGLSISTSLAPGSLVVRHGHLANFHRLFERHDTRGLARLWDVAHACFFPLGSLAPWRPICTHRWQHGSRARVWCQLGRQLTRAMQFSSTTPRGVGATLMVARHLGRHKACPYYKRPLPSLWDKADLRNRDNSIGKLNSPDDLLTAYVQAAMKGRIT